MEDNISLKELCGVHNRVMLCVWLPSEKINMIHLTSDVLKPIYYLTGCYEEEMQTLVTGECKIY